MSLLTTAFQHTMEDLADTVRQEKKITGIQVGQENIKLSPFIHEMVICVENLNQQRISKKYPNMLLQQDCRMQG